MFGKRRFRVIHITNASRRIRNAWHFCHALILVIKVVCGNIALRCSPLKRALCILSALITIRRAHHASIIALNFIQK
ncbi:hypothetical protein CGI38_23980 [Vibrio parahaemolyticus]|nr:hypothetical protein CGI38_23980 [Vibrio parahaemolyticus]